MFQPKISIITICYNSAQTIEKTIQSIVEQDYTNREYIIVDGLSTDNTLSIVNKYSKQIDVIISEKDKGISDAFNKGITRASGDIIVLINSDDILLPDALSKVAQAWEPGVDIFSTNQVFSYKLCCLGRTHRTPSPLIFPRPIISLLLPPLRQSF